MALALATDRALRTLDEQNSLLAAIFAAHPTEETEPVEWKGPVDLAIKSAWVDVVARTILGMANRGVDTAASAFEGCGYLVLGLEPGTVRGVARVDSAVVSDRLDRYLGRPPPRYSWTPLTWRGETVVVVTIEAPRWGDPIYTLHTAEGKDESGTAYRDGAIFIRRPGKTIQATSADIAYLTARSGRSRLRLDVALGWQTPVPSIPAVANGSEEAVAWARAKREALLAATRAPANPLEMATQIISISGLNTPESRTLEEFEAELDSWMENVRAAAPAYMRDSLARRMQGLFSPVLTNLTDTNLENVAVELTVEPAVGSGSITGHLSDDAQIRLPPAPAPFGPKPNPLLTPFAPKSILPMAGLYGPHARVWIENQPNACVEYAGVTLRPRKSVVLPGIMLVAPAELADTMVNVSWEATATNRDGTARGTLSLDVAPNAFTFTLRNADQTRSA
jgi:hypothetical protein